MYILPPLPFFTLIYFPPVLLRWWSRISSAHLAFIFTTPTPSLKSSLRARISPLLLSAPSGVFINLMNQMWHWLLVTSVLELCWIWACITFWDGRKFWVGFRYTHGLTSTNCMISFESYHPVLTRLNPYRVGSHGTDALPLALYHGYSKRIILV
jgi:hypothetical protein